MKREVLIVGEKLRDVIDVSFQFDSTEFATVVVETPDPFEYLVNSSGREPEGVILRLGGKENVADFLSLLSAYSAACFVFLAPEFPPHAAVARVVARHGGTILRAKESPAVIVATLIALLFQRRTVSA